jgi:Flp pilus assembly protein TadG
MKRSLIHTLLSRGLRRSQRGQSILLLAFAFIALLAFVGLVTDVAMLFVRYAALRRAVDAAAIAAAGQVRESTDYGDIAIAAEQYLSLHNLNPDSILVETCETDIYQWRAGLGPWKGDPHPEASYPRVTESMPETELCNWDDPHKLVRVSAQIKSPTSFLALIGIHDITLEATSVSETAALDVALVIDTSESMSKETTVSDYRNVGEVPPGESGGIPMRGECYTTQDDRDNLNVPEYGRERWGGCCNDPGTGLVSDGTVKDANGALVPNGRIWHDANGNGILDNGELGLASNTMQTSSAADMLDPTSPNRNFTTLICRPFKDVKDAARLFIKRLDFVRGDRVVLVTFDRNGIAYDPDGSAKPLRPLIRSQQVAITTLNTKMGVMVNDTGIHNRCRVWYDAVLAWADWEAAGSNPADQPVLRPGAYETVASCGNTNMGGGILAASNALTDPLDIRRQAVWVMVVLSDGAANVTAAANNATSPTQYGYWGYCPWWTFCNLHPADLTLQFAQCTENNPSQVEMPTAPFCNDDNPNTRWFCLDWTTGEPQVGNTDCYSRYDADDYARDMADFAGLAEVTKGKPGNFIAMFSIGFGQEVIDEPTAAPMLRYIADAGDNGFIDNNLQYDLREDRNPIPTYPIGGPYPGYYGDPDVCENVANPTQQCGQYFYAANLQTLTDVFEEIASRMFTRLSR